MRLSIYKKAALREGGFFEKSKLRRI